jgi:phospholipid-binding lipoprotein MlaA
MIARSLAILALALAAGCASTGGGGDPRDPLEPMNRAIFNFNEGLDQAVVKPVATAYRDVVPEPVRGWVRNFFSNIGDLFIGFNNIIQGKPDEGLQDWVRFAVNSFFGVFGINDVASDMGLEKHDEDFGQTFGRWGIGEGPYLVLPIFGPSTLRDGVGKGIDLYTDPVGQVHPNGVRNSAIVVRGVSTRADLLDASRILDEASLDRYIFLRDAFLQRRRNQVYDGSPPRQPRERFDDDERKDGEKDKEDKAPPQDKRGVNDVPGLGVDEQTRNVYLPRVPANYDAVMATVQKHAPNP